ncbi:hypothetical protein C8R46DRAFT_1035117 [Mycena filopes]|nr:hypothetical protein C8R46DRAFT_1035117 [Mycena filopes]
MSSGASDINIPHFAGQKRSSSTSSYGLPLVRTQAIVRSNSLYFNPPASALKDLNLRRFSMRILFPAQGQQQPSPIELTEGESAISRAPDNGLIRLLSVKKFSRGSGNTQDASTCWRFPVGDQIQPWESLAATQVRASPPKQAFEPPGMLRVKTTLWLALGSNKALKTVTGSLHHNLRNELKVATLNQTFPDCLPLQNRLKGKRQAQIGVN